MSRSLGPIHYLMYEKIKMQDQLTHALLAHDPVYLSALNREMAPVSVDPLDVLIDQENIHGWLAAAIDRVEIRLAAALRHCGPDLSASILQAKGAELARGKEALDADGLFTLVNGLLLDGMPCDGALQAYEDTGSLVLHQSVPVHDAPNLLSPEVLNPADSLGKTCDGGHDHDRHESFEVSRQCLTPRAESAGEVEDYYRARQALLEGFVRSLGWRVERMGRDFRFTKNQ